MSVLSKILSILVAIIGVISAIKTLAPAEITYIDFFRSLLFISGWVVAFIFSLLMIYQEVQHRVIKEQAEERHRIIKEQDQGLLIERMEDKDYLKSELSKSNICLNHLTSRIGALEFPIPKAQKQGDGHGLQ